MTSIAIGLSEASHNAVRTNNRRSRKVAWAALAGVLIATAMFVPADAQTTRPQLGDIRLGIANHYKVGHWTPVWVEVDGGDSLAGARVDVTVADSDGVATVASAPLEVSNAPNASHSVVVYTKVGRNGAPIWVSLMRGEELLDERTLRPNHDAKAGSPLVELPATGELVVSLGSTPFGLEQALPARDAANGEIARRTIRLTRVADLPVDWFGYEAVDFMVISAGDGTLCRELAADDARYAALVRWIELGGRLVILSGGPAAEELLAEGGALAGLAPGKLDEVVRLTETGPLEHFAEPAPFIGRAGGGTALLVPRLTDIDGRIEVYAGRRPTDLPLVIRAARGLGEVAFAGVDVVAPPLAEWPGRTTLLQALLRPYVDESGLDTPQTLVTLGYNDLSGALRQRMGRAFQTVVPLGFPIVAGLAVAYLLVLGPLDYWLVHRWLRRPLAAWVTFPIIVILFGAGGLTLAEWRKGTGGQRVNRLELIDVDLATGLARGTFWSALYSPEAKLVDLSVEVDQPAAEAAPDANEVMLSWWGLPGVGVGGMQAGALNLGIVRGAYQYAADGSTLNGVPVLASSTKSLVARWTAPAVELIDAQLRDLDGIATGSLMNRSGRTLRDARLLYGSWGYRLGDLADGQQIDVGERLGPLTVKTIVTRGALGAAARERESLFVPERASAGELLNLMMFYEAAGGVAFARLPNRYPSYCDLSRHLDLGRAILVAETDAEGSRLVHSDTGQPVGDEDDVATVMVRVVLPVTKQADEP